MNKPDLEISADNDVNLFFSKVALILAEELQLDIPKSKEYVTEYYRNFTNKEFCKSIGIPVQDDDLFFHEAASGMTLRIIYYTIQKKDPDPRAFIKWRSSNDRSA